MGLLKTASRAYVATRVVGSTQRRQQQRWASQDRAAQAPAQAPAPPAAAETTPAPAPVTPPATASLLEQLTQLGQLRDSGVLTDAEFETQKQRILAGG